MGVLLIHNICLKYRLSLAHHEINIAAFKAGKHLFTQKSPGITVSEIHMQIAAAKEAGVKFSINPPHMLKPEFIMAKNMLQDGAIGKVTKIYCRSSMEDRSIFNSGIPIPHCFYAKVAAEQFMTWVFMHFPGNRITKAGEASRSTYCNI